MLKDLIKQLEEGDCDVLDESFGISWSSDEALRSAGYHHWKEDCEWLNGGFGDYLDVCACGYKEER